MRRIAILPLFVLAACESEAPPAACGPIPQVTVNAGETATATACFTDPNGDMLTYSATSSNPGVATASISGTSVTVSAVAPGNTSVTVTATDPGGLQGQQIFTVTVPNRPPQPRGTIPAATVPVGQTVTVDASSYFNEPDGETLTYSATPSNPTVAAVSVAGTTVTATALAKGTASVTVTATDPGGLAATQTFHVTVPNRGPVAGDPIPDMEVFVGDAVEVDASGHFSDPDGDVLVYRVATSAAGVARVSLSGSTVRVEGVAQGSASVTVTATDPGGLSATLSFAARVPNRAPVVGDPIPDMEVFVGDGAVVDASEHFTDPDGDVLVYRVATSAAGVARVSLSGSTVRVEGVAQGTATVTVTATDPGGLSATLSFTARVPNRAPVAGDPIPDMEVFVGGAAEVDASEHFSDPDGDALAYRVATSVAGVARVSLSGSTVRVEAAAQGTATVTVTATDPGGLSATLSFRFRVPNRAPVAGDPIPDMEMFVGDGAEVDASEHFTDPDGDALAYRVAMSAAGVARVSLSGSTVRVEGVAQGSATVTVTATDPGGLSATLSFRARVPNRAPVAGDPIPDMEVVAGGAAEVDVAGHFSDPDGDALTYAASSSSPAIAHVRRSGSVVTVTGVAKGTATVTVTARDPHGLAADQTFLVTVGNRAPEPVGTIADREVAADDTDEVDVSGYFRDPDGDELRFTARSSDEDKVRVDESGSVVMVRGVARGAATVTVTARDPDGASADQTFRVTVPNRAPKPVGTIADLKVMAGDTEDVDVAGYFTDPDGDELRFTARSSDEDKVRVDESGSVVTATGVARGTATLTVTARDPGGLAADQTFRVTVRSADQAVLEELYDALDGNNWTQNTNWLTDVHLHAWYGVTTNADERVTRLELPANGLTGSIPASIGRLSALVRLDLGENRIGPSPSEAPPAVLGVPLDGDAGFRRHALTEGDAGNSVYRSSDGVSMSLRSSGITGTIPPELGNLANLEHLSLRENSLTGPIPLGLGDLGRLESLDLALNSLGGSIPSQLGRLSNLTFLQLAGNSLTGPIPTDLGNLAVLEYLSAALNSLTGPIPSELGGLSKLSRGLWLSDNSLTGPIPGALGDLANLEALWLSDNSLTGPIPGALGDLANLEALGLFGNSLKGPVPSELGRLSSLERLFVHDNDSLSGPLPVALEGLPLDWFYYSTTNLCVPAKASFRKWLDDINDHRGTDVDCLVRLTNSPARDLGHAWSPDGTQIAFWSERDRSAEVYVMGADGSDQTRLTNNTARNQHPVWSPDGTEIAFDSHRDGNPEIYVMDADGSDQKRLTNNTDQDSHHEWSPDGTEIAFVSFRDGNGEIYVMDAGGSDQTRLTNSDRDDFDPEWSPDGTEIAFHSITGAGNWEIYVMDADGSDQKRLTNNDVLDGFPVWSPDGTEIAFVSNRDGNWEIYVMDADGSDQKRLTHNDAQDSHHEWSPDGTQIAFVSSRDGNGEIYLMDADGSDQTRLTHNDAADGSPEWSPDGTKIAFVSSRDGNLEIYVMQVR